MTAQPLCLLTVHAHPDDEASKGAPTLAMYHAEGVRTVLVCCTGGEEGDLQNPSLREEGQPFHGLTPEEEKVKLTEHVVECSNFSPPAVRCTTPPLP